MENEKDYKKVFEEWRKLETRVYVPSREHKAGEDIQGVNISPADNQRKNDLEKELINGLKFLTGEQLRFLHENAGSELAGKASQALLNKESKK